MLLSLKEEPPQNKVVKTVSILVVVDVALAVLTKIECKSSFIVSILVIVDDALAAQ